MLRGKRSKAMTTVVVIVHFDEFRGIGKRGR
jgi:hypothetical protein